MKPWEIHPALVHFPIAFLVGGLVLDLYASWKKREGYTRLAAGLLVWGVVTGWIAAAFGFVAFFTAPNAENSLLLYWHPGTAALSMVGFTILAVVRWRNRMTFARPSVEVLGIAASLLILVAGYLGGHLVFREATGVDASVGRPEPVRQETHSPDDENRQPSAR